jgi:peptidoglycan/xylan/chitin deacetylase (PgdA/CDA1 family)
MYHVIAEPPDDARLPELFVGERDFAGQMVWLERHGFHPVTLRTVWDSWHGGPALAPRPIVISFDDGYRSAVTTALPVLAFREWPGVLNLTVDHLRPAGLRRRDVQRLIDAGWEIDAHTITHADLTALDGELLDREVAGSRAAIRRIFGVPADFFCYPSGQYDDAVIAAVRRAGFLGATTTEYGLARASEPFTLSRVRVSGSDGVDGFAARLMTLVP